MNENGKRGQFNLCNIQPNNQADTMHWQLHQMTPMTSETKSMRDKT